MKTQLFNRQIGATADCTLRCLLGTIPPDENDKKFGIRGDAWFGSVEQQMRLQREVTREFFK
jgi:hypothetical protein